MGADAIIIIFIAFFSAYYFVTLFFPFVMNKIRLHKEKSDAMKKLIKRQVEEGKRHPSKFTSNDLIPEADPACNDPCVSEGGRVRSSITSKRFHLQPRS